MANPSSAALFTSVNGTARNRIARLNTDGTLDTTFNPNSGMNGNVYAIALDSSGKPVVVGNFTTVNDTALNRIARLNTDGSRGYHLQSQYRDEFHAHCDRPRQQWQTISRWRFHQRQRHVLQRIARIELPVALCDNTFNPGTGINNSVYAIALDSSGQPLSAGDFTTVNGTAINRFARMNTDGSLDS